MIYPFPVIYIYKKLHFWYSVRIFPSYLSWFNATVAGYQKHLSSLLIGFIVEFFWFNLENLYLIHHDSDIMQQINTVKDNITTFHWCFIDLWQTCLKIFLSTFTNFLSPLHIKVIHLYWFVMIFFFLFNKICIISDYFVFDCFIFISLKIFLTSLVILSLDCFLVLI